MDDLIIRLHGMAEAKNLAARQTQWVLEAAAKIQKLEAALSVSRGQWIHSINAKQCLEALGESRQDSADVLP